MHAKGMIRAAAAAAVLAGCGAGAPDLEALETARARLTVPNGTGLNGSRLNGRNLNGRELNRMLVSVDLAGARPGGWLVWGRGYRSRAEANRPFDAVWVEGTLLHGRQGGGSFSGEDFVGTRFVGRLEDGSPVTLRVEGLTPGAGVDRDVWTYRVSYLEPEDGQWYPICQDAAGRPVEALPVAGRWDYRQGVPGEGGAKREDPAAFTFACEGAAIAKCVRLGYKPWARVNGVGLAAHHQACTRLLRADFCGDGTSHTVDGRWVNLHDALGVQRDEAAWTLEAEWDAAGARCFSSRLRASGPVSCAAARLRQDCGAPDAFSTGALLLSETP